MKDKKKLIIALVVFLAIGFAGVSTTLILNGVINIASNNDDFNVIFTSAKLNNKKRNDFIEPTKKQAINFETDTLTTLGEKAVLDYEVTNTSRNYNANVVINCIAEDNEYVIIDYEPKSMIVESSETKSGRITAELTKVSTDDEEISITCTLVAEATERESLGDEYIEPFSKSGVLKTTFFDNNSDFWAYSSNITRVEFEKEMIEHDTEEDLIFDVSAAKDGSVKAYLVANGEALTTLKTANNKDLENIIAYTLYIQSETGVKANTNSQYLFYGFNNLIEIKNMKYFDTSNVTNMYSMFSNCKNLTEIDLSNFDTSNITDMSSMFSNCSGLTKLNVSNFDTSNVTTMSHMFFYCSSLTTLDVSNFDTSNVTNMYGMFYSCSNLTVLDISKFKTAKVTTMSSMFYNCRNLTELDLSNFDTSSVTDMSSMFRFCSNLTVLDISKFKTAKVTTMSYMFDDCSSLIELDLSNFDTSSAESMADMFNGCSSLVSLDVRNFNTRNVINMQGMFARCKELTTLDLSSFDTSKVKNFGGTPYYGMFSNCSQLKTIIISNFNFVYAETFDGMFKYLPSDTSVYVRDKDAQDWVLTQENGRPSEWTIENVIIANPNN